MTRMTRRLLAGAIVVLIPALAGCEAGQKAPTLEYHQAAFGAYQTTGSVTISNAFVLGPALNQSLPAGGDAGVFLSMFSASGDQLKSVSASGAASVTLTKGPVTLPDGNSVNLTGPAPEIVLHDLSAPLSAGGVVTLTFQFVNAGQEQLEVPVQPQAYAYATYSQPPSPAPSPTGTASPTTTASTTATHHHKKHSHAPATGLATPTATPSPTPSTTP